jgi:hypothetical protein
MAKSSASYQPGESGNPNGRPPQSRALTEILAATLDKSVNTGDRKAAAKRVLAEMLRDAVTTGEVTLPNGEVLKFSPKDWLEAVKWVYTHIDGPVKQQVDMNAQLDGRTEIIVRWADIGETHDSSNGDEASH